MCQNNPRGINLKANAEKCITDKCVRRLSLEAWMSLFMTNIHVSRCIQWNMKHVILYFSAVWSGPTLYFYTGWHKKRELLKNPTKIEEIQEKKIIDRNLTITTCLLRDSNPNYQCLKITSCRWHPPPRMHSFTATTHFKSSRSFVSPCVYYMLCRMRLRRILQSMQYTHCSGSISVNNFFFLDFFNFCWVFQNFPFFCVTLCVCVCIYIYIYI